MNAGKVLDYYDQYIVDRTPEVYQWERDSGIYPLVYSVFCISLYEEKALAKEESIKLVHEICINYGVLDIPEVVYPTYLLDPYGTAFVSDDFRHICFPKPYRLVPFILHEMAHVITRQTHTKQFVRVLIDLYSQYGIMNKSELEESALRYGVL